MVFLIVCVNLNNFEVLVNSFIVSKEAFSISIYFLDNSLSFTILFVYVPEYISLITSVNAHVDECVRKGYCTF